MLSNGRKVGRERRTAGSGKKNGRREMEGETYLEVKGRKREILEREGATKRGKKSQTPCPLTDQAPANSQVPRTRWVSYRCWCWRLPFALGTPFTSLAPGGGFTRSLP